MCADIDADECISVEAVNAKITARESCDQVIIILFAVENKQRDLNVTFDVKHNIRLSSLVGCICFCIA